MRKYLHTKRNNNNYRFKSKGTILSEIKMKRIKDSVVNLSNTPLDQPTIQILSKGLKFIPTPQPTNREIVYKSYQDFRRKMHLRYFFKESTNNDTPSHPFKLKSDFTPPLPDNENLLEFISLVYQEILLHPNTPTNKQKLIERRNICTKRFAEKR